MNKYILEYAPPMVENLTPVNETLRIEGFSAAQDYNNSAMVYRPGPLIRDEYQYHRWRVNPGTMVTDYLLRDLRSQGLFKAVFSFRDPKDGRFLLEGEVSEFLESDENGSRNAVLGVTITLPDQSRKEITEKIIFQKNYQVQEALDEKTPAGFVKAMSGAMKKLSGKVIADIYTAVSAHAASSPE